MLLRIYAQRIENLDASEDLETDGILVLLTRNDLSATDLAPQERRRLDELDEALVRRWRKVAKALPNPNFQDRLHWWWFLYEGPQVRERVQIEAIV